VKRKARHRRPRPAAGPRLGWIRSLRLWMALAWIGALAGVAYGLHELEPYMRRINVADTAIEWVATPDWLHDANWKHVLPGLEARIGLYRDTDIYDERVCPWVAERLAESPWVDHTRRVAKLPDGRVRVHCDFRKPFAMVEVGRAAYLVDESGVRLPARWACSEINRSGWLVIGGVKARSPQPGKPWPGEDLATGLRLARFLYRAEAVGRVPFRDAIRAIDVSNFHGRKDPRAGRLQLITIYPRSYIHWGLPPGEEYGIESSAERKLAALCKLYAAQDGFPNMGPIDVRPQDGIAIGQPE
jgi:hypothetical protein